MKAYKIIKCPSVWRGTLLEEHAELVGRIVISHQDHQGGWLTIVLATPTKGQFLTSSLWVSQKWMTEGVLEEVDLLKEKWIHPHLYKPIKLQVEALIQASSKSAS